VFAAEPQRTAGDYEAYAATLASALEKRPAHPATLYHLARAEALAGHPDDALAHLRQALQLKPEWTDDAAREDDFATLRGRPDWSL
jgi:predicted TPR repeat methyltransferase